MVEEQAKRWCHMVMSRTEMGRRRVPIPEEPWMVVAGGYRSMGDLGRHWAGSHGGMVVGGLESRGVGWRRRK